MDYATYQQRVLARASHRWNNERIPFTHFMGVLTKFIVAGNQLDAVKKTLMYDRKPPLSFQNMAQIGDTTVPTIPEKDQRLFHAMIGVATEGVEMMEAAYAYFKDIYWKKAEGGTFDEINLQEEFGDTEWYRAFGLSELNQTHEENITQNDRKLELRYGGVQFTEEAANNRNEQLERTVLEGGGGE